MTRLAALLHSEWIPVMMKLPPDRDALLRFRNELTGEQWTGRWSDMHPLTNVAYLWWKMTGIERMKGEM